MIILTPQLLLLINAGFLTLAIIVSILLLRLGVLYVRNVGDSDKQDRQKVVILLLLFILFFLSLAAAAINILSSSL